jgi:amino acid permease
MGIGLLSMPYAMKLSGWSGLASLAMAAMLFCFSGKLIVRSFERLSDGPKSYARLGDCYYFVVWCSSQMSDLYLTSHISFFLAPDGILSPATCAGYAALGTSGTFLVLIFATLEFFGALCVTLIVIYKQIESFLPDGGEYSGSTESMSRVEKTLCLSLISLLDCCFLSCRGF